MASSLNNSGSIFGNPNQGIIGGISHGLGFGQSQQPQSQSSSFGPPTVSSQGFPQSLANQGVYHPQAPQVQPTSHTVTSPDGTTTKQTYAPTTGTNPGMIGPQQGTPQYYANQVEQVSQPSAVGQGAANASALYGMLGNEAKLAPFSNNTQGLLNSYANLTRPQSTGNLAGEMGLFNTQNGILQNAANTSAQQALEAQKIQQAGATTNLGASMPQGFSYQSNVINPLTGQSFGAGAAGQGGAFFGGQQAGESAAGQNSATMVHALGAAQAVGSNLTNLISSANINPSDPQFLNSINQFLQTGVASNPQYQQFYGAVNDYVASLAPILGVGGSPTDQKTSMAAQMVSQLASGKSIQQTIQYFDQLAQQKIQGFNQGGSFNGASGGSSGATFGWNG